jgi:hypothetical protein
MNNYDCVAGIFIKQSDNIVVKDCEYNGNAESFIQIEGENSERISAFNNVLYHTKNVFSINGKINKSNLIKKGNIIYNQ